MRGATYFLLPHLLNLTLIFRYMSSKCRFKPVFISKSSYRNYRMNNPQNVQNVV